MTALVQNKPRRTFSPEFKLNIVKEANAPKASISGIARQYDINANQVFRWIHEVAQQKVRWVRIAISEQKLKKQESPPSFLPVTVSQKTLTSNVVMPLAAPAVAPIVTLEFASGHRLQLHQDNPELLKALVAVML
jgi:transposase